ncbi:EF hand protein (macronuclear) [Tetrahymena thermophila SB210]|uniref:EF hand protein n=1 Tax=Tetrahymena thermophila (strain SB210) TaxID=312017 RepID=I7MHC2_TETTS|nr:EF hand protein [Tetrahymena thermophila SB210]EAS02829.1 EF hand protein [Tetrahymena thermophila SB210]|eukprot:XP_001023074.1 EF hand protein [Tetrahymena thermophila SB210]
MGKEGRKFKICSSCILLMFTLTIIYFGETTVKRVKEDIQQWNEEELSKKLITEKINLEYNLRKALSMRDTFLSLMLVETQKYHSEVIEDLSEEGLNSVSHIINEKRIWDALVTISFRLRSKTGGDVLTKKEWEDTIEYFSYSLSEADRQKAIKDQKLIFSKIANKGSDTITLAQYKKGMDEFNQFLQKVFTSTVVGKSDLKTGRSIYNYVAFEMDLYNDCHRKAKQGQDLDAEFNEKCSDKKETNKFLLWVLGDTTRWQIICDNIFKILDVDQNNIIDATEIDAVLLQLEFKDSTIKGFQELLINFYDRNNTRQIQRQDFLQVMDKIRYNLQRYEEEMNTQFDNEDRML